MFELTFFRCRYILLLIKQGPILDCTNLINKSCKLSRQLLRFSHQAFNLVHLSKNPNNGHHQVSLLIRYAIDVCSQVDFKSKIKFHVFFLHGGISANFEFDIVVDCQLLLLLNQSRSLCRMLLSSTTWSHHRSVLLLFASQASPLTHIPSDGPSHHRIQPCSSRPVKATE